MSEHTPGDWVAVAREDRAGEFFVVSTRAHRTVALVYYEDDGDLISAAPRLLAACENVARFCRESRGDPLPEGYIAECEDAVAKAKGEQP
jgi:hypothetical protein